MALLYYSLVAFVDRAAWYQTHATAAKVGSLPILLCAAFILASMERAEREGEIEIERERERERDRGPCRRGPASVSSSVSSPCVAVE